MVYQTTRPSVIERARQGDWEDFVRIYPPLILGFALRRGLQSIEAEDVVQEAMSDIIRRMPEFHYDRNKGGFKAFLRRVVHNKVVDRLRKRRTTEPEHKLHTSSSDEPGPEELFDQQWLLEHLYRAIELVRKEVKPSTYQSFELYVLRELPVEDVARFLNLTHNQVYVNKRRVIRRIHDHLEELQRD